MENWIVAGLLGIGVAMATGFRAFMPLLLVALANRFGIAGISFGSQFGWLSSDVALIALSVAAVIEFVADKIPVLDNLMDQAGIVVRPAMGTIAGVAAFSSADPAIPALIALVALPAAGAVQIAKGTTRVASTATSVGLMNPIISFFEDIAAFAVVIFAILMPILIPIFIALFAYVAWRIYRVVRRRLSSLALPRFRGPAIFRPKAVLGGDKVT